MSSAEGTARLLFGLVFVAGLVTWLSTPAAAADDSYRTEYQITLAGIPIARASFLTEFVGRQYTISGGFNSAGIANLVASISARTTVSGLLSGNRMETRRYQLLYRNGKKQWTYSVEMKGGNVTRSEIRPGPRKRPKDWIEVTSEDLKSVIDPLTGLIIPEGEAICPRTLPIFDGESRMDIVMSPKGEKNFQLDDRKTRAVVCSIRYVPKSGFRKGRHDIEYLAKSSGMEIWFAKTNGMKLYAPVQARIPTRYGPVYVTAVKFDG